MERLAQWEAEEGAPGLRGHGSANMAPAPPPSDPSAVARVRSVSVSKHHRDTHMARSYFSTMSYGCRPRRPEKGPTMASTQKSPRPDFGRNGSHGPLSGGSGM